MPTSAELNKLKVEDLSKLLKEKGLSTTGKKAELIQVFPCSILFWCLDACVIRASFNGFCHRHPPGRSAPAACAAGHAAARPSDISLMGISQPQEFPEGRTGQMANPMFLLSSNQRNFLTLKHLINRGSSKRRPLLLLTSRLLLLKQQHQQHHQQPRPSLLLPRRQRLLRPQTLPLLLKPRPRQRPPRSPQLRRPSPPLKNLLLMRHLLLLER